MLGGHCVKTHSQTQETIALSSGESEFYGIVKAATMGLGMKGLLGDLGVEVKVQVNMDPSAAKSIASRRGAGRMRHIEVRELWVQGRVAKGELSVVKVEGRGERGGRLDEARGQTEDGGVHGGLQHGEAERSPRTLSATWRW